MIPLQSADYARLYAAFDLPIAGWQADLDCGQKCAPYNEYGVPFCCDTRHAVPTAYLEEWEYLHTHSDLWHLWQGAEARETARLRAETPERQVLIACQGHQHCQRDFRSVTCRAFPFFPYINQEGNFIGLSYYWQYEDRCWVLSHLGVVSPAYVQAFVHSYERIFQHDPQEYENFRHHSQVMRRVFGRRKRAILLIARNGQFYKVTPRNGRRRRLAVDRLPAFGPYAIAVQMPFPDER
ncbi:MAG: hypothetical protein JW862_01480 [Anaerolineales bacterium]|nr:hypothetical protein [Anaerolineales bacterium]